MITTNKVIKKTMLVTLVSTGLSSEIGCLALLVAIVFGAGTVAKAADTWDGGGVDNNWSTANNWDDNNVPAFPIGVYFDGESRLSPSNDLSGVTVNSLNFNAGAGVFTLGGNAITLGGNVVNNSTNLQTIDLNLAQSASRTYSGSGDVTINGIISGIGGFNKDGADNITLAGTNSFPGQVYVKAGTLTVASMGLMGVNSAIGQGNLLKFGNGNTPAALTYTGSGVAIVDRQIQIGAGTSSGTGGTTIKNNGTGILVFSNAVFNLVSVSLTGSRTLTLGGFNSDANEIQGVIADNNGPGIISVVKTDVGSWIFSGQNTYSGGTTILQGTLKIRSGGTLGSGDINLSAGGTLAMIGAVSLTNHLTSSGGTIQFGLTNDPSGENDCLNLTNSVSNVGQTFISMIGTSAGSQLGAGTYTLMTFTSASSADFVLSQSITNATLNVNPTSLTLTVGTGGTTVTSGGGGNSYELWAGSSVSQVWDVATTPNWALGPGGAAVAFTNGNSVVFDDSAGSSTVNVVETVLPASVTVSAVQNYILQGDGHISGKGGLLKVGSGFLKVEMPNDYSGGTVVAGGALYMTTNNALGTGPVTLINGNNAFAAVDSPVILDNALSVGADTAFFGISGGGTATTGYSTNLTFTGDVNLGGGTPVLSVRTSELFLLGNVSNGGIIFNGNQNPDNQLTLSGSNTFSAGVLMTNGGTLNINSQTALGVGTINLIANVGGDRGNIVLDNTSGSDITLANNNSQFWLMNDSSLTFTFVGSTNLNLGTGSVTLGSSITFACSNSVLAVDGVINDGGNNYGITKVGPGALEFGGASSYSGPTFVDEGTLLVNGSLAVHSSVSVSSGATLGGAGTINGSITIAAGATIAPGALVGTLTLANTPGVNGLNGATIVCELNQTNAQTADKLAVTSGALDLTGAILTVTNIGPNLTAGTFTLFSAPSGIAGTLSETNLPSLSGGATWDTSSLYTKGTISVVGGVATNPTNITYSANGGQLTLSWPEDHLGWVLQSQTDTLGVGLSVNSADWHDVAGSGSVTQRVITVDSTNPAVFFRLRSPQ